MTYFINFAFLLFADAAPEVPPAGGNGNGFHPQFMILMLGAIVIMFFVMSLPQKRERKRWNDMVEALKKNDRVLMSCGIIGKVHAVQKEKNEIIIKVDDDSNTKMTFSLGAVSRIMEQPSKDGEDK